jgi:predicted acyl esterase
MGRSRTTARARAVAGLAVLALVAAAGPASATADQGGTAAAADADHRGPVAASWAVRPGVEQVTVTGATPGEPLTLYHDGEKRLTYRADAFGQANFAYLPAKHTVLQAGPDAEIPEIQGGGVVEPGRYVIRDDSAHPPLTTATFRVLARDDVPDPSLYERQHLDGARLDVLGNVLPGSSLENGFHYLEMRDGVTLSAMIRFPDPALYGNGPYPTVIEYSGYSPSNPASEEPGVQLARAFGYATVAVNMRGSACAGGVFDVFNPAQQADGYDIVEAVARQPWVLHNHVGMVGLSYSGISQLYVASTRPPHLAAVLPQSVIADPYLEQWPGGIYNSGFAKQWLAERDREASPGGSSWVAQRIANGDTTCAANQRAHNLNPNFEKFGRAIEFYPKTLEARDLRKLVRDINVPVYLTGAFQDEQTGAQFNTMVDNFDHAPVLRVALWNGRHPDGYAPSNVVRWFEFLEFYVAERVPILNPVIRAAAAPILASSFNLRDTELERDRWPYWFGTDYQAARRGYEAEQPVRVIFESGIGGNERGEPVGTFELRFKTWPPPHPEVHRRKWFFGPAESLTDDRASRPGGIDAFRFDPEAGDKTIFESKPYGLLDRLWDFDWTRFDEGKQLSYLTDPLPDDLVVAGPGYVVLYVASEATDVDVQVSISEVRPDGIEYQVQNGWLRLGHRKIDPSRTNWLEIGHSFTEDDFEPLVPGKFTRAKIEIPAFAHAFRASSRLRLTVATPGRNHATWEFEAPDYHGAIPTHRVARTPDMASALVLPVIRDYHVGPRRLPPCPSLRGMPCRTFVPVHNQPG